MSTRTSHANHFVSRRGRTSRITRAALGLVTGLIAATILIPAIALGHAELDTVTPANKSTVEGSPSEIVMTFVQDLDAAKSSIRVVNSSGAVVVQGGTVAPGKPREMTLQLTTPLPPGAYQIRWITFSSEDDERDSGTTTFTVVAPPPSPTPAPSLATAAPSAPASVAPSLAPSIAPTVAPSPSSPPTAPASSTSDALIPILAVVVVIVGLGLWLLRGRSRSRG